MALRILVADDHPAISLAIRSLLQGRMGWLVCGEVTTPDALFRAVATENPDVVVTDYHMPGGQAKDGMRMLGQLRRQYPALRIVVLTMMTNPMILRAISDVPVQGLLLKDSPLDELVQALVQIERGHSYIGKTATRILSEATTRYSYPDERGGINSLSVRETEVLRLYLSGKSVTQIATALSRSVKTISRQKNCAMQKLGASNDRELFDFAARQDLMMPREQAPMPAS